MHLYVDEKQEGVGKYLHVTLIFLFFFVCGGADFFKWRCFCVCVCIFVRERERERGGGGDNMFSVTKASYFLHAGGHKVGHCCARLRNN